MPDCDFCAGKAITKRLGRGMGGGNRVRTGDLRTARDSAGSNRLKFVERDPISPLLC
jgi:hypothetical protein